MERREAGQLNQVGYRRRPHPDPRPAARQPRNRQLGLSAALHRPAWRVPTSGQRRLRRRGLRHRSVRVRGRKNSGSTTPSPPSLGVSPSPSPSPTPTPTPLPSRPPLLGPSPTPGTSTTPTPTPPPAPKSAAFTDANADPIAAELIQGPNPIGIPTNVRVVTVSERLRPFDQPSRYQFAVIGS